MGKSELSLPEAIQHCIEVAEEQEQLAEKYDEWDEWERNEMGRCQECASEHRQLAEWLRELKAYRENIVPCGHCKHISTNTCYYCMFHYSNYFEDEEEKV